MIVRPLAIGEVDDYLRHVVAVDAGSGVDGAGHSHPYSESEPFDMEAGRDREVTRWSTEIDDVGWRRAFGLFDQGELIGHLHLAGGALRSELHRVDLGMGVVRLHRRQGGGTLLLESATEWARDQPSIDWIDLGVFSDNPGARALYARHGFQVLGRTPDRFRVDGQSLDETWMALNWFAVTSDERSPSPRALASVRMRARTALWSVAGPGAFALAAFVGGRMEPGYVPRDEPISALAAHGTRSERVMVPGFFGLAAGTIGFARALRGSKAAPQPVPAMLALCGLTVAGAGLARCSDRSCPTRGLNNGDPKLTDDMHVAFSTPAFALWVAIPLVAAARASEAGFGYRRWSRRAGVATLIGLVGGGMIARRPAARWSGTAQRVTLASAFSWYVMAGVAAG